MREEHQNKYIVIFTCSIKVVSLVAEFICITDHSFRSWSYYLELSPERLFVDVYVITVPRAPRAQTMINEIDVCLIHLYITLQLMYMLRSESLLVFGLGRCD